MYNVLCVYLLSVSVCVCMCVCVCACVCACVYVCLYIKCMYVHACTSYTYDVYHTNVLPEPHIN